MKIRRIAAVAAVAVTAAGAFAPAVAGPKKPPPISKTYSMSLLPVWTDPMAACATPELEGISVHTEQIKPTGPGILSVKVTGHTGDWDISVKDADMVEIAKGSGNDAGHYGPGNEEIVLKFKKTQKIINIAVCNFAGTANATATLKYVYS